MLKISVTYLYTIFKYGCPPRLRDDFKALVEIRRAGFHFLEMEGLGRAHFEGIWKHRAEYKKCLQDLGMHVHNFCGVDKNFVSLDAGRRRTALAHFERVAALADFLGAETLHLASYAPPVRYTGKAPYVVGEAYTYGDKFHLRIPNGFSWQRVWDVLVESCRHAARVAARYGRTIIMEPRVGEIICSVDSMIRLIDDVGMKNFKANFDTAHFSAQRENVPLALMKLEGRFANIHIADNDPSHVDHLPLGQGAIDWREFFRILKRMRYDGYLGLDFGGRKTIESDYKRSIAFLQAIARDLGLSLEW